MLTDMDFYSQVGKLALGSRLRRLGETLMEDAAKIYPLYGVTFDPKWFPVFYVLSHQPEASITEIAQQIGHSHPSVSQIVKELTQAGLAQAEKSTADARVNVVKLSASGRQLLPRLEEQYQDVAQAVDDLLSESQHDLWNAIAEIEYLLNDQSLLTRVKALQQKRDRQHLEILDYSPEFKTAFQQLNYAWIETYFQIEDADRNSLDHPEDTILKPGGHILMARYRGELVGTCALIKVDDITYELAKMTVSETVRGKGIGWALGQAAIRKAQELNAKTLVLESNTRLEPAIKLYQKLGFQRIVGHPSIYERCNIQMELKLTDT